MQQMVEIHPLGGGDFRIGNQGRPLGKREDVGPNSDGRQGGRAGDNVVQAAEQVGRHEREADLLGGLANGGRDEIGVGLLAPAAGQRHVSRPRISRALGAADEEDGIWGGNEDDRDRRPEERRVIAPGDWPVTGQPLPQPGEAGAQWLCE